MNSTAKKKKSQNRKNKEERISPSPWVKKPECSKAWWGELEIPLEASSCCTIGPMNLHLQRLDGEWRIWKDYLDDTNTNTYEEIKFVKTSEPEETSEIHRYAFKSESNRIKLNAKLADRPAITRPLHPFEVLPRETITVFAGSPLWMEISIAEKKSPIRESEIFTLEPRAYVRSFCAISNAIFLPDS